MDILYFLVFLEPCNGTDIYGLCYWSILEKLTFLDANSKCGENNGTLAEIPNQNSNNFVSTNLWVAFVSSLERPAYCNYWWSFVSYYILQWNFFFFQNDKLILRVSFFLANIFENNTDKIQVDLCRKSGNGVQMENKY